MNLVEVMFWIGYALMMLVVLVIVLVCTVELLHSKDNSWAAVWTFIGAIALVLFALLFVFGSSQKVTTPEQPVQPIPLCPTEDSVNCYWDGGSNGVGRTLVNGSEES